MRYEYNGNLTEEDRIKKVSGEIVDKYPNITKEEAENIAMLEGRISTKKDLEMQFNRLSNIILILDKDILRSREVYNDLIELIRENKKDEKIEKYYDITMQIGSFILDNKEFPFADFE